MKLTREIELKDFEFWSGAKEFASKLTNKEFAQLEPILEDCCMEGMDETQLNDIFWFEQDWLCEMLDTTVDEVYSRE